MKLTPEEYRRRVEGCWIGKNIGGTLGMPMEWNRATNDVSYYTHDISGEPLPNDDLDIQVLWLLALEDNGLDLDAKVLGRYFNELMIFTHAEYGTAKANLRVGLEPPYSGIYKNDFKHSCGSFIRSEIWACLFPGYPALAAKYAFEDAIVDHGDGEGVYAEVFFAALESAAFFEPDLEKLIEIGLTYIPADCAVARAIRDGVDFARRGVSKETAREYMMQHYIGHIEWHYIAPEDERKGYGEGPFGFDVPSNMFIIAYNLVAGRGDLEKSMCGAVWFGEDTDCTAGTIAALHGIRCGIDSIDKKWIEPIGTKIKTISIDPFRMESRIPKGHLRILGPPREAPCAGGAEVRPFGGAAAGFRGAGVVHEHLRRHARRDLPLRLRQRAPRLYGRPGDPRRRAEAHPLPDFEYGEERFDRAAQPAPLYGGGNAGAAVQRAQHARDDGAHGFRHFRRGVRALHRAGGAAAVPRRARNHV